MDDMGYANFPNDSEALKKHKKMMKETRDSADFVFGMYLGHEDDEDEDEYEDDEDEEDDDSPITWTDRIEEVIDDIKYYSKKVVRHVLIVTVSLYRLYRQSRNLEYQRDKSKNPEKYQKQNRKGGKNMGNAGYHIF